MLLIRPVDERIAVLASQAPDTAYDYSNFKIQNPKSKIQNPKSKIQNPKLKAQSSNSKQHIPFHCLMYESQARVPEERQSLARHFSAGLPNYKNH
jgi:hypothetical protein